MTQARIARFTLGEWLDALKNPDAPLTSRERHCGLTLASFMGWQELWCFPSVETLAGAMGCAESTVRPALKGLEGKGYVRRRRGFGRGNSTRYFARLPRVNAKPIPERVGAEDPRPPIEAPETSDCQRLPIKTLASSDGGSEAAPPTPEQRELPPTLYERLVPEDAVHVDDGVCDDCGNEGPRWLYGNLSLCAHCYARRYRARKDAA